jgi:hypothetical protein
MQQSNNLFKVLATAAVKKSIYSTSLKLNDGLLANKLHYIGHVEAFYLHSIREKMMGHFSR